MVPSAKEPPGVELTDQETAVLDVPVTVAENVRFAPARMLAVAGVTETEMDCGLELPGCVVPELQATQEQSTNKRNEEKKMREEVQRMMSVVSCAGREKDNWTEGQKRGRGNGDWKREIGNWEREDGTEGQRKTPRAKKVRGASGGDKHTCWRAAPEGGPYSVPKVRLWRGLQRKSGGPSTGLRASKPPQYKDPTCKGGPSGTRWKKGLQL